MGWTVCQYSQLSAAVKQEIVTYFQMHTAADTRVKFNIGINTLKKVLADYKISMHSAEESSTIKHFKKDKYDTLSTEELAKILDDYTRLGSVEKTCDYCDLKPYFLLYLLRLHSITPIFSKQESSQTQFNRQLQSTNSEEVISFYLAPNSLRGTAEHFRISKKVVETILDTNNIVRHDAATTTKIARDAAEKTNLVRYGCKNAFQSEIIKSKIVETKQDRYNDAYFTNRPKSAQTCLEKYGATSFLASSAGQADVIAYNKTKYGTDYAFQSITFQQDATIKAKRKQTFAAKKYSDQNYSALYLQVATTKESFATFIQNKTVNQLIEELDVSRDHIYYLLSKYQLIDSYKRDYSGTSQAEQEIVDFIGANLCIRNDRTILAGREIDIYVPSKKIGIEYNGTYWHSTEMQMNRNYHFDKSRLAEAAGIRLIHIYEYEWQDPIQREKLKLMLNIALGRVKYKLYARQCTIKKITNKEAAVLNNKIHLQGHRNAQITYGLYYKNDLVQLMSFSQTRYNRNLKSGSDWEIIRGCPGSNNIVVGGVTKLLSHFIRDYSPDKIFSYCDFNKFDGRSYLAAGMNFVGYTGPDMKWVMPDYSVVNRNPKRHAELKEEAIAQIFGAGSKKFELTINK